MVEITHALLHYDPNCPMCLSAYEWQTGNNGTGRRKWFLYRDFPEGRQYYEDSRGRTIRFATKRAAFERAKRLAVMGQ